MHMGSSPIVRTNKKKTPPIGGVFFLLAPTARSKERRVALYCSRCLRWGNFRIGERSGLFLGGVALQIFLIDAVKVAVIFISHAQGDLRGGHAFVQ